MERAFREELIAPAWNRFYTVGNPLGFSDPKGEDVSIMVRFRGDGWTDQTVDAVLQKMREFWSALDVGEVYIFNAAEQNQTNPPWTKGVTSIVIDANAVGSSHEGKVAAGEFLGFPGLSQDEKLQAVANAANHELFTHTFSLGRYDRGDLHTFSINRGGNVVPEIAERYGTIQDSLAWRDPGTRSTFTSRSLPVHPEDRRQAQRMLQSTSLKPPSPGPNRWWKFW